MRKKKSSECAMEACSGGLVRRQGWREWERNEDESRDFVAHRFPGGTEKRRSDAAPQSSSQRGLCRIKCCRSRHRQESPSHPHPTLRSSSAHAVVCIPVAPARPHCAHFPPFFSPCFLPSLVRRNGVQFRFREWVL